MTNGARREHSGGLAQGIAVVLPRCRVILPVTMLAVLLVQAANVAAQSGSPTPKSGGLPDIVDFFGAPIDPKTPITDLLPAPPTFDPPDHVFNGADVASVPTLGLQEPLTKSSSLGTALKKSAQLIPRIEFLNQKKTDGFIQALIDHRADLAGLPFQMGDDCRLNEAKSRMFRDSLEVMRQAFFSNGPSSGGNDPTAGKKYADPFWNAYRTLEQAWEDGELKNHPLQGPISSAALAGPTRLRALLHVVAGQPLAMRKGLVKYLAGSPKVESTQALARLALFESDAEIRQAALNALSVRREKDYEAVLLAGLRYPWPVVAQRAAETLVKLERKDVATQLVDLLELPDPRLPRPEKFNGKEVFLAKHLVRMNHHQNCLLCHPPVKPHEKVPAYVVVGPVAVPGKSLPPTFVYYGGSSTDIRVRTDVTYLRPEFSLMEKVADPVPQWPDTQRFDYLLRTVVMNQKQAEQFTSAFKEKTADVADPYQEAVVTALRALTGVDGGTKAAEWRKALKVAG